MKLQYQISLALLGLVNHAAAQSVAETRTYDGSVQVQRDSDSTSRDRALPPAPIAIVNAGKEGATAWAKGSTGQTTLKAISGTQDRSSTLNPTGDIDQAGSYAAMPAVAIRTGAVTQWVARSSSCSAHYTGQITWEAEQRKTVVAPVWADTGAIRNHKDECTPVVDTTWVSESAACASGYSGSNTWEAEQSSTAGGPYVATGNVRNVVNTCALIVVEPTPTPDPTPTPTPTPTPDPTPTPTPDPGDTGGGNGGNAPITGHYEWLGSSWGQQQDQCPGDEYDTSGDAFKFMQEHPCGPSNLGLIVDYEYCHAGGAGGGSMQCQVVK